MAESKTPIKSHPAEFSGAAGTSASHSSASPALTLRRVTLPTLETVDSQVQRFLEFLTGVTDTLTLNNVEVVPTVEAETPGPSDMARRLQREDPMDIDSDDAVHQPRRRPLTYQLGSWRHPTAGEVFRTHTFDPQESQPHLLDDAVRMNQLRLDEQARQDASRLPLNYNHARHNLPNNNPPQLPYTRRRRGDPPPTFSPPPAGWSQAAPPSSEVIGGSETSLIECQACRERQLNPIFLTCGHAYCRECLNGLVRAGTTNRVSWPPKCCGGRTGIEVEAVQAHLDQEVLIRYVSVSEEYNNRNPVYCANKSCSHYFEQTRIENNEGKFIACSECGIQTCTECKQGTTGHVGANSTDCKKLEDLMTEGDQKLAKSKKWKQCPGCRNLVERIDGCSHMSCQCGIDFCYDCGARREAFATACPCTSRLNRQRRQIIAETENAARRAMERVRNPLQQVPRRLRTTTDVSTPVSTATPQAGSAPVGLTSVEELHRTAHDRMRENMRADAIASSNAVQGNSGAHPESSPGQNASPRFTRPRPRPQYENSRPIFPAAQSELTRTGLAVAPPQWRGRHDVPRRREDTITTQNTLPRAGNDRERREPSPDRRSTQGQRYTRFDQVPSQASDATPGTYPFQRMATRSVSQEQRTANFTWLK